MDIFTDMDIYLEKPRQSRKRKRHRNRGVSFDKEKMIIFKKKNNHSHKMLLETATTRMTKIGHRNMQDLPKVLREVAMTGIPAEFQFNIYRIKYLTRDEYGNFLLHWIVGNGLLGTQKEFHTKDYVSQATGKIAWRRLAKDMTVFSS